MVVVADCVVYEVDAESCIFINREDDIVVALYAYIGFIGNRFSCNDSGIVDRETGYGDLGSRIAIKSTDNITNECVGRIDQHVVHGDIRCVISEIIPLVMTVRGTDEAFTCTGQLDGNILKLDILNKCTVRPTENSTDLRVIPTFGGVNGQRAVFQFKVEDLGRACCSISDQCDTVVIGYGHVADDT